MGNKETLLKFMSEQGYKRNSPDKNRPFNIIPSNNITMKGVDFPVLGMSNTGHIQKMYPGMDYEFDGDVVFEIPMKQQFGGDMKFWRPVLQTGGEENFNKVKDWYNDYIQSPLYRKNLEQSGYNKPDEVINQRLKNVNRTDYVVDENRSGSYYKNLNNKIYHSPESDVTIWSKEYTNIPESDDIIAHEFGHAVLDNSDNFIMLGGNQPYINRYDYKELELRNKNPKISRGVLENYADQKALQYEAAKLGIYNPGYEEFTKEHLDKIQSAHKNRALENYSEEDLIWLMNNIAQVDNQSSLPIAQKGKETKVLYVNDANDPRYRAYQDSISAYNNSINFKNKQLNYIQKQKQNQNLLDRMLFGNDIVKVKTKNAWNTYPGGIKPLTSYSFLTSGGEGEVELLGGYDVLKKPQRHVAIKNTPPPPPPPPAIKTQNSKLPKGVREVTQKEFDRINAKSPLVKVGKDDFYSNDAGDKVVIKKITFEPRQTQENINITPQGLVQTNTELIPNLNIIQQARTPKYFNVTDRVNQPFGGTETNYKVYPDQDFPSISTQTYPDGTPMNTRQVFPVYQFGGTMFKSPSMVDYEQPRYSYPVRKELYPGEDEYFKANPHVGGMAAEDNQVIINPYSSLSDEEKQGIIMNETARLAMRNGYARPTFDLTPEQKEAFKDYSSDEQDRRETIIGRILSGDPSAGNVTPEQKMYAKMLGESLQPISKDEDYDMERALELGYTPDETGHWPSVDYETGEWLKSKKHHTRGMELMAYELNPELHNAYNLIENEKGKMQYIPKAQVGFEYSGKQQKLDPTLANNILKNIQQRKKQAPEKVNLSETPRTVAKDNTYVKQLKYTKEIKPIKKYAPEDVSKLNIPEQVTDQINYVKDVESPNQNFAIIDKDSNIMYYVNPKGQIIGHENVITGATNKDRENAPSMSEYGKTPNEYYEYLKRTNQKITPEGVYTLYSNKNDSYGKPHSLWDRAIGMLPFIDDVKLNTLDDPSFLHAVYNEMPWREQQRKEYYDHRKETYGPTGNMFRMVSQYGVPSSKAIHGTSNKIRINAINTPNANRNLSNGCINVGGKTMCFDLLQDKSKLYILPEEKDEFGQKWRTDSKKMLYAPFGHYEGENWVPEKDLPISREDIKNARATRDKIAAIAKKNKINATPYELDFAAAVAQKETKGGKSWLSSLESTLPGFSSYGLYEQKEDFPYLKGKSPNDEVASTQAVIDFYRDMMKKHPELEYEDYPLEKIYSTYNSGREDWNESGIYYGQEFRKILQAVKGYKNGGLIKAQDAGTVKKRKLGPGKYYTTTGKIVDWGTPEYEKAYNRGEVLSEDGVPSEVTLDGGKLDQVVIKNNYKPGFWEKYRNKIVEENKDAGFFGAILGTPISAVTSIPQLAATYALTNKMQRPSEALDIQNPFGAFVVNAVGDPANWFGGGLLDDAANFTGKARNLFTKGFKKPVGQNHILPEYMSLEAPKGNMYGENQVIVQQQRLLNPKIKAKFFEHQAPIQEPYIEKDLLGTKYWKQPKDYGNRITPENYDDFIKNIHSSTGYDLASEYGYRPGNLGVGNYGKQGVVFSDAPLNKLGKDIINAHEKNHGIFVGTLSKEMKTDLLRPFGTKKPLSGYPAKHQEDEVLARMAQFKNALGMGDDQIFTLGHLNLIRKNYANRFIDNSITEMLSKIKPGSAGEKEFLKNMNKYAFGITAGAVVTKAALPTEKQGGLIKAQAGKNIRVKNTDGTISVMNTDSPEYREMYKSGMVQHPSAGQGDNPYFGGILDEVSITRAPKEKGFWEQSIDKYLKDNRDAGVLGAIGSVVTYPLSVGQHALTYGTTGKVQDPSEAWGYNTDEGWFDSFGAFGRNLVDASLNLGADPVNLVGVGLADDALKLTSKGKNLFRKGFKKPVNISTKAPISNVVEELADRKFVGQYPTNVKLLDYRNINTEVPKYNPFANEMMNVKQSSVVDTPLPKELEPYLSSYVKPISQEEEVFRMSMGPEYRAKKLAEDTVYLDANGNIISAPKKTHTPFIEDEDIKYINSKKNKNINDVPEERSVIRSSSVIDINDIGPIQKQGFINLKGAFQKYPKGPLTQEEINAFKNSDYYKQTTKRHLDDVNKYGDNWKLPNYAEETLQRAIETGNRDVINHTLYGGHNWGANNYIIAGLAGTAYPGVAGLYGLAFSPPAVKNKVLNSAGITSKPVVLSSKDTTINITNKPMDFAKVNETADGQIIIGGEFIEDSNNTVRKAKDWLTATDTYSDKEYSSKDIQSFYGIENGKFKVGKASDFKPNTEIVPRRFGVTNISQAVLNEGAMRLLDNEGNPIYQNTPNTGKFILYSPSTKEAEFNYINTGKSGVNKVNKFLKKNKDAQYIHLDNGRYEFYALNPNGLSEQDFKDYYQQDLEREGNPGYNMIIKQQGGLIKAQEPVTGMQKGGVINNIAKKKAKHQNIYGWMTS